jgi:hypothetical protein
MGLGGLPSLQSKPTFKGSDLPALKPNARLPGIGGGAGGTGFSSGLNSLQPLGGAGRPTGTGFNSNLGTSNLGGGSSSNMDNLQPSNDSKPSFAVPSFSQQYGGAGVGGSGIGSQPAQRLGGIKRGAGYNSNASVPMNPVRKINFNAPSTNATTTFGIPGADQDNNEGNNMPMGLNSMNQVKATNVELKPWNDGPSLKRDDQFGF